MGCAIKAERYELVTETSNVTGEEKAEQDQNQYTYRGMGSELESEAPSLSPTLSPPYKPYKSLYQS